MATGLPRDGGIYSQNYWHGMNPLCWKARDSVVGDQKDTITFFLHVELRAIVAAILLLSNCGYSTFSA